MATVSGEEANPNLVVTTGTLGTPIASPNATIFFIAGTVTGTLPAVGASSYLEYTFIVVSGTLTLTAASGGTITIEGTASATNGNIVNSGVASATLVCRPGTSTWFSKNGISGAWNVN